MPEFPLAARELTRTGRMKRTYVLRTAIVAVPTVVIFFMWFVAFMNENSNRQITEFLAGFLWGLSLVFQYGVVLLIAPLVTAGLIAREKEERTLPLLLMADLRGLDIVLAKFLTAFLYCELLMLSTLPLLAFASIFGSIDVPAMAATFGLLSLALAAICAVMLLASTVMARPSQALALGIILLVLWFGLTAAHDADFPSFRAPAGPADRFLCILIAAGLCADSYLPVSQTLLSAAIAAGIAVLSLGVTAVWLPLQAHEKGRRARRDAQPARKVRRKSVLSPIANLAAAGTTGLVGSRASGWRRGLLAVGLVALAAVPCWIGTGLLLLLLVYDVTTSASAAVHSGSTELLRVTPATDEELSWGIFTAFLDRGFVYYPALVATGTAWPVFMIIGSSVYPDFSIVQATGLLLGSATAAGAVLTFTVAVSCFVTTICATPLRQIAVAAAFLAMYTASFVLVISLVCGIMLGEAFSLDEESALILGILIASAVWLFGAWCFYRMFFHDFRVVIRAGVRAEAYLPAPPGADAERAAG